MNIYFDFHDWWIGYYRGENYHFVCPLPTLVIRWARRKPIDPLRVILDEMLGVEAPTEKVVIRHGFTAFGWPGPDE